jgi:hypothetical protein
VELVKTGPLAWWLEKKSLQRAKFPVSKTLACANSACTTDWMAWYREENWRLQNALLDKSNVLNSNCLKHFA